MTLGTRWVAVGVFAVAMGAVAPGVAAADVVDDAVSALTVQVREPDVIRPLPLGLPPVGPAGCDDWNEPYENNVPEWGADSYNQYDNWCDGHEDGLPQPAVVEGDEGGGDSPNER